MYRNLLIAIGILGLAVFSAGNTLHHNSDATGPTLNIEFTDNGQGNEVDSFMYFLPLIIPATVDVYKDPNTTLNAHIISRTSNETATAFTTTCIFQVRGHGVYEAVADADEIIAFSSKGEPKDKVLRNQLRSIRVDGPMRGSLVVSGSIKNGQRQVDKFDIRFDLDGKSPVSAHLYEVKPVDGKYCFQDRYNEQFARIDALSFTRSIHSPTMEASISSIAKENTKEDFLTSLKAMVANWFLPPVPITVIGNQTMMDFGTALDSTQTAFIFPYADNLRQNVNFNDNVAQWRR